MIVRRWAAGRHLLVFGVLLMALAAGYAGPGNHPSPGAVPTAVAPQSTSVADSQLETGTVRLLGAGATLPAPLYERWFADFSTANPAVQFNYQAVGSGNGIRQITIRAVDFGASDAILTAEQYAAAPGLQMLPMVGGTVVVAYSPKLHENIPSLVLTGNLLADIFLGKVQAWDDPSIARLNPGVALPSVPIIVVRRSDASGTTAIFTDYLTSVSSEWASSAGVGTTVSWPTGVAAKGSDGVVARVLNGDGAIGYVELAYAQANKLPTARLANRAGQVVEASIESTQSAMKDFAGQMPEGLARSIVNAPGPASWPIAGYTYLLVYRDQSDCGKGQKLRGFIRWALTAGSRSALEMGYVPLPEDVRRLVFARLDTLTCNGQPLHD